jgi:F420-0:gamma-glutamyl ligase
MSGVIARGIKAPLVKAGDDLVSIIISSLKNDLNENNYQLQNNDIVCITEAIIARSDNNYASVFDIRDDVKRKFKKNHLGIAFPIFSRNRFETILRGLALGADEVTVLLTYPRDEVGNALFNEEELLNKDINPYKDTLTFEEFTKLFPNLTHPITGVNYPKLYLETIKNAGAKGNIIFSNDITAIYKYTTDVVVANIHDRDALKKRLLKVNPSATVYTLAEILNTPSEKHGYNEKYGLLGSNKAGDDKLKLFPKNADKIVKDVQKHVKDEFNVDVEVLAFGDGAFKDPATKIWELADPVVGIAYTDKLNDYPNEVKLKYLLDEKYKNLSGKELEEALKNEIHKHQLSNNKERISLGTTPRKYSDLLGSLSDLIMGSGDKGTPFVLIQNYFTHYK